MLLVNETLPAAAPGDPATGLNVTVNCWDPPAAIVNGKAGNPATANVLPVAFAAEMVTLAPIALKVPVWDALLVPSGTEAKFKLALSMLRPAPVPDIVAGENVFDALLVNDNEPEELPGAFGAKERLNVAELPDVIVTGKVMPLSMNPAPLSVSLVTVTSPLAAFKVPV